MDEDVLGTDNAVTSRADPHGIVIVLKEPEFELLVEWADALIDVPPHGGTKHDRRADVEDARVMPLLNGPRKLLELAIGPVGNVDLSFVAASVGKGADHADVSGLQVPKQPCQPCPRHQRVIVEQNQEFASGLGQTLIAGRRKTVVAAVEKDTHLFACPCQIAQVVLGAVVRTIVDND